jgi:hypothetical protein
VNGDRPALVQSPSYGSEYAKLSFWTAVSVNTGVAVTLDLLQLVVAFPPTSCEESSCTWGPWVDGAGLNRWQLRVEKRDGEGYDYALSAQNGVEGGPFLAVLEGTAYPGQDADHGHGSFTIDFDAEDALAHGPLWTDDDHGQLLVTYDNRTTVQVNATVTNGVNDDPANPHLMNAVYAFEHVPGAGGRLQLALENLDTDEAVTLHTRWNAEGAGRGDVEFFPGAGGTFLASECWAGEGYGFAEVYDTKGPFGANEACAAEFRTAVYADVTLP